MKADPQISERLRDAAEAPGLDIEQALSSVGRAVEGRRRRKRVEAMFVAAAIVAAVGFAAWSAAPFGRTTTPATSATPPTVTSSATPQRDRELKVIPPPPGHSAEMTPQEVEAYMLSLIAADETSLGKSLVTARVLSIRFVLPNDIFRVRGVGGLGPLPYATWVVKWEGTHLVCSSWCSANDRGVTMFADGDPSMRGEETILTGRGCLPDIRGSEPPKGTDLPAC